MPSPPHSRPRKVVLWTLGAVLGLGLAAWLVRDQPRRTVAALLAERLGATVRLDRLEVLAADRFVLAGLELSRLRDVPSVERLRIAELEVDASLGEIRANRFRRLRLRGVEARLVPAPTPEIPARPLPEIAELVLEPTTVRLAGPSGADGMLSLEATLFGIAGSGLRGRARLRSPDVLLAPWLAVVSPGSSPPLAGRIRDLDAELQIAPRGRPQTLRTATIRAREARLTAEGRVLELAGPRLAAELEGEATALVFEAARAELVLAGSAAAAEAPRVEAAIRPADAGGGRRFELRPELAGLGGGRVEGVWDPASHRLERLDAELTGLDLDRLLPDAGFDATADVELHSTGDRLAWTVELLPRRLRLGTQRELTTGGAARLVATGSLPFGPLAALAATAWEGTVEATLDLPAARGRWDGRRLPPSLLPRAVRFEGRWQGLEPLRLAGDLCLETATVERLEVSGELLLAGGEARGDLTWAWTGGRLDRLASLARDEGLLTLPLELAGTADASGTVRGLLARPSLDGELRLRGVEADGGPWRLADAEAIAAWSRHGSAPLRLRSLDARGTLEAPDLRPLPLTLTASGRGLADGSRGELETATLTAPGLGAARLAGGWETRAGRREARGEVVLEALALDGFKDAARPLLPPSLAAVDLRGTARAELAAAADGAGTWRLEGPVDLTAAGFASDDGSRVMEGLGGRWHLAAGGSPGSPAEVRLRGRFGGFVLLWDTFFGDFSTLDAILDVDAALPLAGGSPGAEPAGPATPWRLSTRLEVPGGPVAEATVEPAGGDGALRWAAALEDRELAATHARYLAPLLEAALGRVELGGRLAARARGSRRGGEAGDRVAWSLFGELALEGFRLASGGGQAEVAGLDLELPLELRRAGPAAEITGPRLAGRLAFERLALRGLELPRTQTDLWVEADTVGLEKPVTLSILGGRLTLGLLTLRRLLRADRHLETAVDLVDVRLDRVAEALRLFPLEGTLNGDFPRVRLSPERLWVDGGGRVEVFGGVVEVRDISGEDVLTRFPKLQLSADFRDLDLGALTRRLDFGEMTGRLSGSLEDCLLFRGVPVRFSARLATVETPEVPRTVDVKAIDNLSLLGTGQRTNVFDLGLRRFFKKYRYERLGVTLRLDDDRLLLRGLERRGDRELFLRGRFPFRIDVVNAQPGKTVSFQAMVQRLRNLDLARASTKP